MTLETNRQLASKRYIRQAVQIVFALFLLELLAFQLVGSDLLLTPILVSVGFALFVELGDALSWKRLESKGDETKATFFMAVSGFRFLLAWCFLFIIWTLTVGECLHFFCCLLLFIWPCLLITLYFSRICVIINRRTFVNDN